MTARTLRVERAISELTCELPVGVASQEVVEVHMHRLVEDYGLPVAQAQDATRTYLTSNREAMAGSLVTQLAQTTETPPTRDDVVADLELLGAWHVPLANAYDVVRREYDPADPTNLADTADQTSGVPQGATDAEVAAAVPVLDDPLEPTEDDHVDPDSADQIIDADASDTAPRTQPALRAMTVERVVSITKAARRLLIGRHA